MEKNKESSSKDYYLGIDIGGTKCSISIGGKNLKLYEKKVFPTIVERGPKMVINEIKQNIRTLINKYGKENLKSIGISCGGPLDSEKGVIYSPPNLPGWDAIPITDIIQKEFGIKTTLQNDANASALAEWLLGAGKDTENMIFLTFGTGMGAGLILNSKLYSGTNDLGGEVGHIRLANDGPIGFGKAGSFEGFCSGRGIAQLAEDIVRRKLKNGEKVSFCTKLEDVEKITAKIVAQYAQQGEQTAKEIIEISATYLGRTLALLIDILNPQCIVIGSIYSRNEYLFKPFVEKVITEEAIPKALEVCKILPAALGENIGDFAALCVALYNDQF